MSKFALCNFRLRFKVQGMSMETTLALELLLRFVIKILTVYLPYIALIRLFWTSNKEQPTNLNNLVKNIINSKKTSFLNFEDS